MDRDAFVQAMIAELEGQQQDLGATKLSTPRGSTGRLTAVLAASEVFRKLCFDYPMLEDLDWLILQQGLATIGSSANAPIYETFTLNSAFVQNVIDFSTSREEVVAKSELAPIPSGGESRQLAQFLFLSFPCQLLHYNRDKLSFIFSEDTHFILASLPRPVYVSLPWIEGLRLLAAFVLKSSCSVLCCHAPEADLIQERHFDQFFSFIETLNRLVTVEDASKGDFGNTLLGFIATSLTIRSEDSEEVLTIIKNILTHYALLVVDIFSMNLSLISSCLSRLLTILLPSTAAPILGPSVGEYLALLVCSNLYNIMNGERSKTVPKSSLSITSEAIRKAFSQGNILSRLVQVCEHIQQSSTEVGTIDVESASFLVYIAELLFYRDRLSFISSTLKNDLPNKLISSRLLPNIVSLFMSLVDIQHSFHERTATTRSSNMPALWSLSSRVMHLLSGICIASPQAKTFLLGNDQMMNLWLRSIESGLSCDTTLLLDFVWTPGFSIPLVLSFFGQMAAGEVVNVRVVDLNNAIYSLFSKQLNHLFAMTSLPSEEEFPIHRKAVLHLQMRWLESLETVNKLLKTDDFKIIIGLKRGMDVKRLLSAAYSTLSTFRTAMAEADKDEEEKEEYPNNSYLDRAIRSLKETMSFTEGGRSSKVD